MTISTGTPATPAAPTRGRLRPLGLDEVRITGGFWAQLQDVNAVASIPHIEHWLERVGWIHNFDLAAAGTLPDGRQRSGVLRLRGLQGARGDGLGDRPRRRRWPRGPVSSHRRPGGGSAGGGRLPQHAVRPARPEAAVVGPRVGSRALLLRTPLPGRGRARSDATRRGRWSARRRAPRGRARVRRLRRRRARVGLRTSGCRSWHSSSSPA